MARVAPASTLACEHVDVGLEVGALRMLLRIGRHRDLDVGIALLDAGDQFGRGLVAVGMRRIGGADPGGGIAAQRHDMADADVVILRHHVVDLAARGADAGQMRGRDQAGLVQDAGDGGMGALAGRTAGAIGHRDEIRRQRRQPVDGVPQALLHLLGLRREKLKGDRQAISARGGPSVAGGVVSVIAPQTPLPQAKGAGLAVRR